MLAEMKTDAAVTYNGGLDETGFQNYFSPSPVGQNCYMPNYYFYPQAYPQPPPVYTLPPLPPAPIYAPASPEELDAFPASAPPNSIDSRRPEKRSVARNEKTQGDDEGFASSRDNDADPIVRRNAEDATTLVTAQSKAPVVLEQREKSGKISPNS
ncbi:hypothetical protein HPB51_026523 [Rhipicephalus microplus]|uniref:Uncharacterized protein n=1 Tax=Rhipicephalus microplus TaxID=6941 RepID=A0A9J6D3F1_RHIMP|nr:hypothetical protein HPB51_026523 [Rhipicephalus microplus]